MKLEKKNYPQVYLEGCKYKVKKKEILEFIDIELKSDSSFDSKWLYSQEDVFLSSSSIHKNSFEAEFINRL